MKIYLSILVLSFATATNAQEVSFEQLDSTSAFISQLQKQTDGKIYKEANGDSYEISYPGENFKAWYQDKLASHAVFKKRLNKESLLLTENIDFAQATGISIGPDYNGIVSIKVDFPKGHLETQIIENGVITGHLNPAALVFFCKYGAVDANKVFLFDKMFYELYELAARLKIENKLTTESEVVNEIADFATMDSKAFIKKYPSSMLAAQAKQLILEKNQNFMLRFAEKYNYKPGLTLEEFADLSPENSILAERVKLKKRPQNNTNHGPYDVKIEDGKIVTFEYLLTRKNKEMLPIFEQMIAEIRQNVDAEYIQDWESFKYGKYNIHYYISVPGAAFPISIRATSGVFMVSF